MKKEKILGITLTLLLLAYVFTSSSVYAQTSASNTESQSTVAADTTNAADTSLTAAAPAETDDIIIEEESAVPLVQSMSAAQASPATLYAEQLYDSFFEHTVFVGDSITVGFSNYCASHADSIATDTTYFLAKESGSAKACVSDSALTTYANVMPVYNGSACYVEDAIADMDDIEKVFICYGMNDLVVSTPEQYVSNMSTLITRILEQSPQVTIYVISVPCIVEDAQAGLLSNDSIQSANALMQSACTEHGWGFLNLSEYLMDSTLSICAEYSADGYVHENSAAYDIWCKVLRNYAYTSVQ